MMSNSKILGNCRIGSHVVFADNSYVKDRDIPDNSIVFGQDRDIIIKPLKGENTLWKNVE